VSFDRIPVPIDQMHFPDIQRAYAAFHLRPGAHDYPDQVVRLKLRSCGVRGSSQGSRHYRHVSISNTPQAEKSPSAPYGETLSISHKSREEELKMIEEYIETLHRQEIMQIRGRLPDNPR
jgi:hypothetical protein